MERTKKSETKVEKKPESKIESKIGNKAVKKPVVAGSADKASGSLPPINDADFNRLVTFVRNTYGIDLHQKRQLITSRLSNTIKGMGYSSFKEYVDFIMTKGTGDDVNKLLSKLTTNYTYFMREMSAFDCFNKQILPDLVHKHQKNKSLAIWSAGCSSGEEPYNITMYMFDYLGAQAGAWDTRILATDLSMDALSKAQKGIYELPDSIPPDWKKKYFKLVSGRNYQVTQRVRDNVIFRQFNLMEPIRFKRKFDLIFCRNVMIYFDQETKTALTERFYEATVPGGYLIISTSENLTGATRYKRIGPSIFQK